MCLSYKDTNLLMIGLFSDWPIIGQKILGRKCINLHHYHTLQMNEKISIFFVGSSQNTNYILK